MFTLTSIPRLSVPVETVFGLDKLAHVFLYLIFAWLFIQMHDRTDWRRATNKLLLLAAVVPLADELHQIPIPGRMFSIWDVIADLIGFAIIILIYRKKTANQP